MRIRFLLSVLLLFSTVSLLAQVGINTTTPNAQLEIKSSNESAPTNTDGLIIPKVNAFPAINPTAAQQGMMVYLTTTSGTDAPGFYYWDNATVDWKPIAGTSLGTLDQAYDFGGTGSGRTITADAGAVTINGTDGLVSTGTYNSGALAPSGGATKMVWNPRKAAFRAGRVFFNEWDDTNIGFESVAFGSQTKASGSYSSAFGWSSEASGIDATAFGLGTKSANAHTFAAGYNTQANGILSTVFGDSGIAPSYGETVLGIGATTYTPSSGGNINFQAGNVNDRLFVIGNAIDANANFLVESSERSDALIILKNGLTRLPSTTNAMITAADGKAVVTKEYLQSNTSGTLDQAYDFGGAGLGRTITADTGAVSINGSDGLVSIGLNTSAGVDMPSGSGTRMVWNPKNAAFRAGNVVATEWDDINTGYGSVAFGYSTRSSGNQTTAFGFSTTASGHVSTAFGESSTSSGVRSTAFGFSTVASGQNSTVFGVQNSASSFCETVLGIGATTYTTTINGSTQFRAANATDRLFVIGNAIDANNNTIVDNAERSDAMVILKNGLTRLPSTTNAMITAADGKAVVTKEYLQSNTSGTLDQAYDFGGAGLGRTITADTGAVLIDGTDGLVSTGTSGSGAVVPSGAGTRMVWNPRKAAFRAGTAAGTEWDDANVGTSSIAMGFGTRALGISSVALGSLSSASGMGSVAFGWSATANATQSTAFGLGTNANNIYSTAFGYQTIARGRASTSFGVNNEAQSFGEVALGIGATLYTPSTNGANEFRTANASDRLFVIGNAIDLDNDDTVDAAERSDAMVVLKNGNIGIGNSTPLHKLEIKDNSTSTTIGQLYLEQEGTGDAIMHIGSTGARHFNMGLDTSADSFKIGTSATTATAVTTGTLLTVQATGEVGIGTATPTEKLHVSGPAGLTTVRIANTSGVGATSNVALDFFRNTAVNTDWRIYNIGPNLTVGNSADDLATVTDLYQFQGVRFMPMNDGTQSLGQAANRWNTVFATNGTINTSDRREKKQIQPLHYGLNQLMQLKPVSFKWNNQQIDNGSKHLGFIAQDLQEVLPEVVVDSEWTEEEGKGRVWKKTPLLGVNYAEVIPVLVQSIQEQQAIIEAQKKEIEQQKSLLETVLQRLTELEKNK